MQIFTPPLIWFIVGLALMAAELALPGFIVIFFGAGAWVAALAALLLPVGLSGQLAIFLIASLISLFALRRYAMKTFKGAESLDAEESAEDNPVGRFAVAIDAMAPGVPGEVKYRGSFWKAVSDHPVAAGAQVVIVAYFPSELIKLQVAPPEGAKEAS